MDLTPSQQTPCGQQTWISGRHCQGRIYLLKVNKRNTRTRRQICSKLTIKTLERRQ